MTLVLHKGSREVTIDDVLAVPVPAKTSSWAPVPYRDAIGLVHEEMGRVFGGNLVRQQYGLNKNGNQLFAVATVAAGCQDRGMSIGLRQSYDKSLALGVVVGAQVFVCDNLCFSGSALRVVRKNTTNAWRDFRGMVRQHLETGFGHFQDMSRDIDAMKHSGVTLERGFEILGRAMGERVLSPTQATVAFGDWREPRHEEFSDRNLWSLYNTVTEALKRGTAGGRIDRQARAHGFFSREIATA